MNVNSLKQFHFKYTTAFRSGNLVVLEENRKKAEQKCRNLFSLNDSSVEIQFMNSFDMNQVVHVM